jgi:outer membrane murein-binding lipoprotein Lpp
MLRSAIILVLLLSGCADKSAEKIAADKAYIAQVSAEVAEIEKRLDVLKAAEKQIANPSPIPPKAKAKPVETAKSEKRGSEYAGFSDSEEGENLIKLGGWCFKDYCPCEPNPDNSAVDRLHCDMMETGGKVDSQMLAVARASREVRRQLRTGDY